MPFFGAFNTNHNFGFQGHVRLGATFEISIPDAIKRSLGPLGSMKSFSPYLEGYHTWNSLKKIVWEVQDGDTVRSGNMFYFGIGGRMGMGSSQSYTYGLNIGLGLLNEYEPTGENTLEGGHRPPKFSPSVFAGVFFAYEGFKPLYFLVEYNTESLGSFSDGYTGWHEVDFGVGLLF